ncbi:hypothetical protein EDB85DRAFT_1986508 [Lactarius pseudohatsudake]|nr:hypothetical protein EDB85DRAFT_1986508 [Lactarius pseudohatsudake]
MYQRIFLLGSTAPLALQLREGLLGLLCEERDDKRLRALVDGLLHLSMGSSRGMIWSQRMPRVTGDLGIELKVLYEDHHYYHDLLRFVCRGRKTIDNNIENVQQG